MHGLLLFVLWPLTLLPLGRDNSKWFRLFPEVLDSSLIIDSIAAFMASTGCGHFVFRVVATIVMVVVAYASN